MDKKTKTKISKLHPESKKQIKELFEKIHESIDVLYDFATRDEKTGLYNSQFFDSVFDMEIEKSKRGKQKLTLLIIDIDFFKKINDKYGHVIGDDVLRELAKVFQNTIRKSDVVARFGGEEFILLFPETNLVKAKKLISRIKSKIKNNKFLEKYKISVSGGLAEFKKSDTKRKLISRADKLLYKAKHQGRDRFCDK